MRLRSAGAALLALGLASCGSSIPGGLFTADGIPHNGTTHNTTIINGHVERIVAFGQDGKGYRLEWSGDVRTKWAPMPSVRADDADFDELPDGTLVVLEYEDDEKLAWLEVDVNGTEQTRRFWSRGVEVAFEPEGAAWLAKALPQLIDYVGLGADSRVPRLLEAGGVTAVLTDIERRQTDRARNAYYEALVETPGLPSPDVARALAHAGPRIESDAHLADLLKDTVESRPGDATVLGAVLDAAVTIASDAHLADLLETVVEEGAASAADLDRLLQLAGSEIESDAHLADLLDAVVDTSDPAAVSSAAFRKALCSIDSDAHLSGVLEDLVEQKGLSAVSLASLLDEVAPHVDSDAHLADVLDNVPVASLNDPAVRRSFVHALDTVQSDAHQADVLEDMIRVARDPAVVAALVRAAGRGVQSDAHLADVLEDVRPASLSDHAVRAAMRDALDTIESRTHRESVENRFPDGALES